MTFCSGETLIAPDVVLTAGHCTDFWTTSEDPEIDEVLVSFAPQAAVDADWNPVNPADWHTAHSWVTHPDYVSDEWPLTWDYGLLFLDDPVQGITPADLPAAGLVDDLIGDHGQTAQRFSDVGYGQNGVLNGGGPPVAQLHLDPQGLRPALRPGQRPGSGILHPAWFILGDAPSANHGGGCGGDSGRDLPDHRRRPARHRRGGPCRRLPARPQRGDLRAPHGAQHAGRPARGPGLDRGRHRRTRRLARADGPSARRARPRGPHGVVAFQPLGVEPAGAVDGGQPKLAGPGVA